MVGMLSKGRVVGFSALGALLILVGVALYSARTGGSASSGAPETPATTVAPNATHDTPAPQSTAGGAGQSLARDGEITASVTIEPIDLTPPARLLAEGFKCVCGCDDILAECTCDKTPGSHDMKQYLQQLVDEGKPPAEVRKAMVEKYGQAVLP